MEAFQKMIMRPILGILALVLVAMTPISVMVQEKGGADLTGPYDVVPNWLKPLPSHEGWTFGNMQGVFAESPDRIYILERAEEQVATAQGGTPPSRPVTRNEHFLFIVNRNGQLVEAWTQWDKLFVTPHKLTMSPYDPEKHLWVIDDAAQQIFKFTHDGKRLVMTLGEHKVSGNDETHFNRPTDIAFLPDGTFFVGDGYVNARVVKFDKNGKYLKSWGTKGAGPGSSIWCTV